LQGKHLTITVDESSDLAKKRKLINLCAETNHEGFLLKTEYIDTSANSSIITKFLKSNFDENSAKYIDAIVHDSTRYMNLGIIQYISIFFGENKPLDINCSAHLLDKQILLFIENSPFLELLISFLNRFFVSTSNRYSLWKIYLEEKNISSTKPPSSSCQTRTWLSKRKVLEWCLSIIEFEIIVKSNDGISKKKKKKLIF